MRLLVDCHCFDYGEAQGINTYLRELYKAMIPMASDITFIFAAQNLDRIQKIFGEGKNIEYLQLGTHSKYYRLAIEFPKLIKTHSIDWAHFQYTTPLIKKCKYITTLHDILFEDYPNEFPLSYRISKHILFKASAKNTDLLLTVSNYSKERIAKIYNIEEDNIFVTHNGVSQDYQHIDKQEARNRIKEKYGIEKYILYVSRFEPRKNQQALLRAYKHLNLSQKGYKIVFIGIKSLLCAEFDMELSTCDSETKKNIHLFENISYQDLKNWYAGAELFVYPSKAEGFGIPPLEAGACLTPVICNNQTAMRDFDFFSPYHITTDNQPLLETTISSVIQSIQNDTNHLRKIQESIYLKYSWNNIALDFYKYLKSKIH
jgi:glycosyltransferase involved in cell wall biosynthesis